MGEYLSFDGLMAVPAAAKVEHDLEIPGYGTVRIRALSAGEYWQGRQSANETGRFDEERWQAIVLSTGMLQPRLSYDEAMRFSRERPFGVVWMLSQAIVALTMGIPEAVITEKAVGAAEASFRGESGEGAAVPAG